MIERWVMFWAGRHNPASGAIGSDLIHDSIVNAAHLRQRSDSPLMAAVFSFDPVHKVLCQFAIDHSAVVP